MTRAALYARYSSDRQNERSVADQLALLTELAERRGWTVVQSHMDAAISAAAMANRPGLMNAIAAAERGEFDVLLVEDEDRIARDEEHQWHVFNRLKAVGVRIANTSTESITPIEVAFKGLMAAQYLVALSDKTKRGMRSNAEKGLATGSKLYGYRSSPGGGMEIVAEEADVIRRIFADYVDGCTPRKIAQALNAEGVGSPRGGLWGPSTIVGSRNRGNGILNTDLYVGVKTWGRTEVRKDRLTGKRVPHTKPRGEWKTTPVPHLQIVSDDIWAAVRAKKDRSISDPGRSRTRPGIFSGLLKCGQCGGSYTVYTTDKLVCSNYRDRGSCTNRRTPSRSKIEQRILSGLQEKLLTPEAVARYVRTYHQAAQRRKAAQASQRGPMVKRLAEVNRGIERVVDAIVSGAANDAMKARMKALDDERVSLEQQLAAVDQAPEPAVDLHPNSPAVYSALIAQLLEILRGVTAGETAAERELIQKVRGIIDKIEIRPVTQDRHGPIDIELFGTLANFMGDPEPTENARLGKLVAGGGYNRTQPSVPFLGRLRL